ncbi:MAG: response regulator [Candidatus Omnitrophica bacterium]|nr:response regulator [Candidatus Omnitrophota bacterium]MDD5351575.1 response regulator [Candidatus Omnitrophota bacterium]MDD5551010.1 response regulator [Candidatus Omnitrophota bacterium]
MKKKILVVDDEQDIREIIKITLTDDGFEVIEAGDGRTAIELAKKEKPDLITMDVIMPNIDGLTAAKIIKEDPETKDIPIVILSVLSQDKNKYVQGISDYISKPFSPEELMSKIKGAIEKSGLSSRNLKNILVVDDEPDVIDIVTISLKEKGFNMISANNGLEALERLKTFMPNLIIVDINMPLMNGFELIKHLKKEPRFNNVPIVVLTGTYLSKQDKEHGLTLGASKYLTKPFTIETLVKDIEDMLCQS